ncbi:outer membrane protein assembly factor BamB family protein [Bremerella sp. P1]|uniref:outer membrane protein assembly factor BamB family protein n=1 Tax=Bremerella sp. P1 TaxID=3026424 RepID=UPI002368B9CE|nr:PQQ-binding-like beta-propeller repeat protein [Bremerella sp. P1]WDI39908.1 PQQ-binding-like beta-propeller repeat protein [Bremerella sp. P1]
MIRLLCLLLVLTWGSLLFAGDSQDWKQYNYDNAGWRFNHGEQTLNSSNAGELVEKWRFPGKGSSERIGIVHAMPVIVNGFVYFGTTRTNPAFYKLTPSGKLAWKYQIKSVITAEEGDPYIKHNAENVTDGVMNSALVQDGKVFFGTFGGQVICLDRYTGEELWRVKTKKPPFPSAHQANTVMSSPIMADGKLIVAGGGFEHSLGAIPEYKCCSGRGFVAAFDPDTGDSLWVYNVGPQPEDFPIPIAMESRDGKERYFVAGPSTSSVWCTPSYDPASKTLFFGTDTHNAPRRATPDDSRPYNKYSSAIIAINCDDGKEKWVRQLVANDVWNNALAAYNEKTGEYKDLSIGDTPKIYTIQDQGKRKEVLGVGCKNGSFYVIDRDSGEIIHKTPTYQGPPKPELTASKEERILALPSAIGGLQTGCAYDGKRVYVNGIDWPGLGVSLSRQESTFAPSGGRVTAISPTSLVENWRHERKKVDFENHDGKHYLSGDPVPSGIAVANDVMFFTTNVSGKLSALNTANGKLLKEFRLGPVWCGPAISRGRVYVGSGNNLFRPWNAEKAKRSLGGFAFPLTDHGTVYSFGLPGVDEVSRLPEVDTFTSEDAQ